MNYYPLHHINPEHGPTSCAINTEKSSNKRTKKQSNTSEDSGWPHVDYVTSLQTQNVLASMRCLKNLEDEEAVIKMKKRMRQRRHTEAHNSFNALTCEEEEEEEEHRHVEAKKGTKMEVEAVHELRAPACIRSHVTESSSSRVH